jgi:hypothetical protein
MAADRDSKFIVEFEDGTRDYFFIDTPTLRTGDHVARIVARNRQAEGKLPKKPIKSVTRSKWTMAATSF